jgi:sigma-54 specific flagellar transcriptional regulator A
MTSSTKDRIQQWLVPVAPELLVSVTPGEAPRIEAIPPQLAAWVGQAPEALRGQPLAEIFDALLPVLSVVVEETSTSGYPIRDYRVTFTDHAGMEHTVLLHARLRLGRLSNEGILVALQCEELLPLPEVTRLGAVARLHGLVGGSRALRRVFQKIEIYGPTDAPVIITGETGTGKELAARAIHAQSQRQHKPFVAVNCAALSDELLETELFGHERGAFTSAVRSHRGRFERAHGGTLFLDEIGEMPLRLQAKLLRVLEEGRIERVGGECEVRVDVRLVTATNVPLEQAVLAKAFRLDLYHRLEVLRVHMPPLRERPDDIPPLVEHFLASLNAKYQRHIRRLTPDALALLQAYTWPGNIRELRNVLERVYVETIGEVIGRKAFDEWVEERSHFHPGHWDMQAHRVARSARPTIITPYHGEAQPPQLLVPPARHTDLLVDDDVPQASSILLARYTPASRQPRDVTPRQSPQPLTLERIMWAYQQTAGNITQAAQLLGVNKVTLYRHMKARGVTRDDLDGRKSASRPVSRKRRGEEPHE